MRSLGHGGQVGLPAWHSPRLGQDLPPASGSAGNRTARGLRCPFPGGRVACLGLPGFRASGCHLRSLTAPGVWDPIGFPSDAQVDSGRCPLNTVCLGTIALSARSRLWVGLAVRVGLRRTLLRLLCVHSGPGGGGPAGFGDWIVEPEASAGEPGKHRAAGPVKKTVMGKCAPAPQLTPLGPATRSERWRHQTSEGWGPGRRLSL